MVSTCCTGRDTAFASLCPLSASEGHRGLEPRRPLAPPSCDHCHITISQVLSNAGQPWHCLAHAPCWINPTNLFLRASLWPLPHQRMGLGRGHGKGDAALHDLGVTSPAPAGVGLDWESGGWPAARGVPWWGRQRVVRSSWERRVPGRAGRVENHGKVLSDRQLSHLLDL